MAWLVLLVALVGVVAVSMVKFLCLVLLFVLICDQKKILFLFKKNLRPFWIREMYVRYFCSS